MLFSKLLTACTAAVAVGTMAVGCADKSKPVLGGVDMVEFQAKPLDDTKDVPVFGSNATTSTLNGFTFHFKNDANKAAFDADPWRYAPVFGGFCAYGVAYENQGGWTPATLGPQASLHTNAWIGNGNADGRTFMNRGVGAKNLFESQTGGIAAAVAQGEKVWAALFPGGNSTFIFNTNCFYDPGTGDDDEASPSPAPGPGPSPGPAPSGACAAAIAKACPGLSGTDCMDCCKTNHATLINSCPGGAPDMRAVCNA